MSTPRGCTIIRGWGPAFIKGRWKQILGSRHRLGGQISEGFTAWVLSRDETQSVLCPS